MRCTFLLIVLARTTSTDYTATSFLFHTPEISIAQQQSYQRNDSGVKGILIKHGPAKFKFKKEENPSYFATLETNGKEITLWGVGLKTALYRVELGSEVELSRGKKERVEVDARQYDEKGQFVGIEKFSTYRQSWSCDIVSI